MKCPARINLKLNAVMNFETLFPEMQRVARASLPGNKLVRFTDESKTDEGSGTGI